jgi:acyl carrier protein
MKNIVTRQEIKDKIAEILLDHKWIKPDVKIKESHEYMNTYDMDSLDMVDFVMDLEREYGISIPDDVVERMDSVARTIDYIHQQLNNYESKQN